jgi:Gram-negative bacterial TonB protein C-terminal
MRKRHAILGKITGLILLSFSLLGATILESETISVSSGKLQELYLVDVWENDSTPLWESGILHAQRRNSTVEVDYIRIASSTTPCSDPRLSSLHITLPNIRLEDLTDGLDLCSIDVSRFNHNAEKHSKQPEAFASARSAVVARCGNEERMFKMPEFKMNMRILRQVEPSAEQMSGLFWHIIERAFPKEKLSDIQLTSGLLEELKSGLFDSAYWYTVKSSSDINQLRYILENYQHPARGESGRTGTLLGTQEYKLKQYVAPNYPLLAARAHVEGKVVLSLEVDRTTGQVRQANAISGHVLLKDSAIESVKQWQYDLSQTLPEQIEVVLDFSLHCGN